MYMVLVADSGTLAPSTLTWESPEAFWWVPSSASALPQAAPHGASGPPYIHAHIHTHTHAHIHIHTHAHNHGQSSLRKCGKSAAVIWENFCCQKFSCSSKTTKIKHEVLSTHVHVVRNWTQVKLSHTTKIFEHKHFKQKYFLTQKFPKNMVSTVITRTVSK